MDNYKVFSRELSWLSFNHRVLQEAMDDRVPLHEKIKFLAIFSSNLDEFYRVRVASYRNLLALKKKTQKKLEFDPRELVNQINNKALELQELLGDNFRNNVIKELNRYNIYLVNDVDLNSEQKQYAKELFQNEIQPLLQPIFISENTGTPFLKNRSIYFVINMLPKKSKKKGSKTNYEYALVEIPTQYVKRFLPLPQENKKKFIIIIDDIIKMFLPDIFPGHKIESAYSIKLTRDAEMYIDDEFSGDLLQKIKKGLAKRKTGVPSRLLFDKDMPSDFLNFLKESLVLTNEDLVEGGRYHNFNDFFTFPNLGTKELEYEPLPPLQSNEFERANSIFQAFSRKDILLNFPYQSYDYVLRLLEEAADDPKVISISITLYRVAANSRVVECLIKAAQNGKKVLVFVELKARFDEESNIYSAQQMEQAGIKVFYSFPGLKVHSKLLLIKRKIGQREKDYAYLATGNFNEKTAKIYCDMGLFTCDTRITRELQTVFKYLSRQIESAKFENLLVAPFNMRKQFYRLIDNEVENVKQGKKAEIILKLNSLQDTKMIYRLYDASNAGVKIKIIVRGICCLIPGIKDMSENIEVTSIVDRYLEHARIYIFHNGGNQLIYSGSADWMRRNLSRRIEVIFPILNKTLKNQINDIMQIQLNDTVKTRIIDSAQRNDYKKNKSNNTVQAQIDTYNYLKDLNK